MSRNSVVHRFFGLCRRFHANRRGAIALIFAGSLLPLVLLVGLSIDYSFYAQARSQFSLAGDAAATYAIREATATYTLETQAGVLPAVATPLAIAAGKAAGAAWFTSQLATLPRAYVYNGGGTATPTVNVTPSGTNGASGFTATVAYVGVYPPFFDPIFKTTKNWYVTGTSAASSSYSYVEILMLLDTSGSMLIGAEQSDITALDENTVCIPTSYISWEGGNIPVGDSQMNGYYANDSRSALSPAQWLLVPNYGNGIATDDTSTCNSTTVNHVTTMPYNNGTTTPLTPCAFACHATTSTATDGYYQDLYGMARRLNPHQTPSASGGVTLRIDAVFAATENIINDMINSEQTAGQFSVGVYQFNDDVSSIVAGGGTDAEPEATSNLPTALSTVKSVDWMQTPSETAIPTLAEVGGQESNDFTNFGLAMNDLYSGTLASGTQQAIQPAGSGYTATAPQKDLFIVTDGLDDTTPLGNAAVNRLMGEMTSVTDENNTGYAGSNTVSTPLCRKFKNLGFTVYVLYINYNPIPSMTYYYTYYANASTPFVATDYPLLAHAYASYTGGNIQNWVEGDNTNNTLQTVDPEPTTPAPDIAALTACASTPQDFYTATNTASINTAMAAILKSALTSTTRLTQ